MDTDWLRFEARLQLSDRLELENRLANPIEPQGSGISPSSTTDTATKAPVIDALVSSHPPSIGNVSPAKTEEPQSTDTSFGVEASAVRQLAADTGTLAIYSSTTGNSPAKEHEEPPVIEEPPSFEPEREDSPDQLPEIAEEKEEETTGSSEGGAEGTAKPDSATAVRQVPQITETLVASLDPSPSDENEKEIPTRYSPEGADQSSADVSGKTEVTKSTECSDDQPANQPKVDESKSDNNESNSTKTFDNDISSEQLKTNSLSDLSFSDLDEKDLPRVVEVVERIELSGESDSHSEPKLVEITPSNGSTSDSSQQITKEESTSDISSDRHTADGKAEQDEEPLLDSGAEESIELDADEQRKVAAVKIQSSFRGYKVRKTRSTKSEKDHPDEDDPKLTESEIENVKTQVDDIIKEAEVKSESLRNTPDIDEEINTVAEEEFPAPPDDLQLSQLERDDSRDKDKDISLNIDPVPYPNSETEEASGEPLSDNVSQKDHEHSPPENEENTSAEMARMTADEDLPAPDLELLESSCTDDLNTELAAPEKVLDEEPRDSTEGDLTISEDSEELKLLQKPQACDEGVSPPEPSQPEGVDQNLAATKIQANVRGFLTRKQTQKEKKPAESEVVTTSQDTAENADSKVVETAQAESSKAVETAQAESSNIVETAQAESSKVVETAEVESSKVVETAQAEISKVVETAEAESSKVVETAEAESSKVVETAQAEISKVVETVEAESSKAVETAQAESSKVVETAQAESSKVVETAEAESSKVVETVQAEISKVAKSVEAESSKAVETAQAESSKAVETAQAESSKVVETAEAEISKVVETAEAESSKVVETAEAEISKAVETAQAESQQQQNESPVGAIVHIAPSAPSSLPSDSTSSENLSTTTLEADYPLLQLTPKMYVELINPSSTDSVQPVPSSSTAEDRTPAAAVEDTDDKTPSSSSNEDSVQPSSEEDKTSASFKEPVTGIISEENGSKSEALDNSERIEFSSPSPSHDTTRCTPANDDTFDKASSASESLSQDTTSTSQYTVEENPLAARKPSAEDDKFDDVFEPPLSDSKEPGKPEAPKTGNIADQAGGEPPSTTHPEEPPHHKTPVAGDSNDSTKVESDPSLDRTSPIKAQEPPETPAPENVPILVKDANAPAEKLF